MDISTDTTVDFVLDVDVIEDMEQPPKRHVRSTEQNITVTINTATCNEVTSDVEPLSRATQT